MTHRRFGAIHAGDDESGAGRQAADPGQEGVGVGAFGSVHADHSDKGSRRSAKNEHHASFLQSSLGDDSVVKAGSV